VKRPVNILYGVDDSPPPLVTILSGIQFSGLLSIYLVYPLAVAREAGVPGAMTSDLLSFSLLLMGLAVNLQALRRGPVGCGYLCPAVFTAGYLPAALLAARQGGMPLVAGMTAFAGLIEIALSRLMRHLRALFPPEIAGLVVMLVGITAAENGLRFALGIGASQPIGSPDLLVAGGCLATMAALTVWGKGPLRLFGVLIGMAAGYGTAAVVGRLTPSDIQSVVAAPLARLPTGGHLGWSFDPALMVAFAIPALAASLRAMADITTCQKINDAEWVRPDMRSISGGLLADGLSTVACGLLGSVGLNTHTNSVGLTNATGITSRRVAWAIGGVLALLALSPKVAAVFAIMPRPVMGVPLFFLASFTFVNGLQIVTSRMVDARRILVVGMAFMSGLAVEFFPAYFAGLPARIRAFASGSLVLGTVLAIALNLIFRLGVRRIQKLTLDPAALDPKRAEEFLEEQGATWGARRDVIDRAAFNLAQGLETIAEGCSPRGALEIEASFDEFNLDVRVSYVGAPLELPDVRPTNEEIMASEEGQRRLAGFLLRRHADRVQSWHRDGRSTVLFHFDH